MFDVEASYAADAKDQIVTFGVRNLATLTIESVRNLTEADCVLGE